MECPESALESFFLPVCRIQMLSRLIKHTGAGVWRHGRASVLHLPSPSPSLCAGQRLGRAALAPGRIIRNLPGLAPAQLSEQEIPEHSQAPPAKTACRARASPPRSFSVPLIRCHIPLEHSWDRLWCHSPPRCSAVCTGWCRTAPG